MPEPGQPKSKFNLLPFPRSISLRGAPFRPAPSNYLYISTEASVSVRRKCNLFCQQLQAMGKRTVLEASGRLGITQALFTQSATFPKWDELNRPLRAISAGHEGYRLTVADDGVLLHGADEQGLQYAATTLRQLMEDGADISGMEIEDCPLLPVRAMHLDFKGWPPTFKCLKRNIEIFADLKINALILEYEAWFNFPSQPGLAPEGALTPAEMSELELLATDLGVTLIPQVSCVGHAGHLLRLPAYAALREHPHYFLQYCIANPQTLGVVTAMIEDLRAVHHGKYFHVGGDEVRLLGVNPASDARAKQLGGRTAVYLEYIGKLCRFLSAGQRTPLIWDDMFRKMNDEQMRWVPPEAVLTFWQYEGQGGRATPAILQNLDRYRHMQRRVWGAATRTPAARYDSFDNIDAWTEAAELGYMEGLITTAWTRDYTLGAMHPPPESAWPAAFYAAERTWSGLKALPREQFPQRFVARMFGAHEAAAQSNLWSGLDLMLREHPRRARDFFRQEMARTPRNRHTLAFLESWCSLGAFKEYMQNFENEIGGNYANLSTGRGEPFHAGRLRWRLQDLKSKLPPLLENFRKQASRLTTERVVQEYLESSIAYALKKRDEMEALLSGYALPPPDFQQPVQL